MLTWFATTLRSYPEIALFLSLAIGYYVGGFSYRGFALGAVTSTLLAAILIGQLGITISPNVKSVFFLIFLFAVGTALARSSCAASPRMDCPRPCSRSSSAYSALLYR